MYLYAYLKSKYRQGKAESVNGKVTIYSSSSNSVDSRIYVCIIAYITNHNQSRKAEAARQAARVFSNSVDCRYFYF
jgi:hypothetical protein